MSNSHWPFTSFPRITVVERCPTRAAFYRNEKYHLLADLSFCYLEAWKQENVKQNVKQNTGGEPTIIL